MKYVEFRKKNFDQIVPEDLSRNFLTTLQFCPVCMLSVNLNTAFHSISFFLRGIDFDKSPSLFIHVTNTVTGRQC